MNQRESARKVWCSGILTNIGKDNEQNGQYQNHSFWNTTMFISVVRPNTFWSNLLIQSSTQHLNNYLKPAETLSGFSN